VWRTLVPTLAMMTLPLRFWRRVAMEDERRLRRAALVPVAVYVICGLLASSSLGTQAYLALRDPPGWTLNAWPAGTDAAAARRVAGGLINPLSLREYSVRSYVTKLFDLSWRAGVTTARPRDTSELLRLKPAAIAMAPMAVGVFTPMLSLLPASTRRKYRIRGWHVARIGIYGAACTILIAFLGVMYATWSDPSGWSLRPDVWYRIGPAVPVSLVAAWSLVWWWSATRRYLRIERAFVFAAPLVLAGLLAGFTASFVLIFLFAGSDVAMSVTPGLRHLS
ncbi:MAG: hypothetical protein AAFR76_12775, partial [Planctomycetota bacterium]